MTENKQDKSGKDEEEEKRLTDAELLKQDAVKVDFRLFSLVNFNGLNSSCCPQMITFH